LASTSEALKDLYSQINTMSDSAVRLGISSALAPLDSRGEKCNIASGYNHLVRDSYSAAVLIAVSHRP
jgi:hypothetical protein